VSNLCQNLRVFNYYLRKKPIGRKFDFVTSPEISQMFGEIIGVYLLYHWKEKINSRFYLY